MALPLRVSHRVYAALLLLYPTALRQQFGEEMLEVFTDQMRDARNKDGWVGEMAVWRCVAGETVHTVVSSHLQTASVSVLSILAAFGLVTTFFWSIFGQR
jgi:hypothetical protein